jgi:UDP-N-acetylmuramoylalanine--D-glutamate ligase
MIVTGRHITVFGLARSGYASCKLLLAQGAKVTAIDAKDESELRVDVKELRSSGIQVFTGNNSPKLPESAELLVISPGIPLEHPMVRFAKEEGIPVIGELELASRFCDAPIIAVTGTNGKSTTTALIGYILEKAGVAVEVGGNIGIPFSAITLKRKQVAVVEVSSYQLETIDTFKPHIAVWLNLTPDHLARHGKMEDYGIAKARIFKNQTSEDFVVFNADDQYVTHFAQSAPGKRFPFSFVKEDGVFLKNNIIYYNWNGSQGEIISAEKLLLKGKHNIENALAATATALAYAIAPEKIASALSQFPGIEHRQELVAVYRSVTFINDSKATNLDSGLKALETIASPIILIAGGRGKGESYSPASSLIRQKVKLLITLGETAEQLTKELSGVVDTMFAKDMREAVRLAWKNAGPCDKILLSPMCASFDMFSDFEERGRVFKALVKEITDGNQQ